VIGDFFISSASPICYSPCGFNHYISMRLIEVARKLGMTGQQLRRELKEVDFGVKPTDREIADRIAQGIIRYVATKHGITIKEDEEGVEQEEVVEDKGADDEEKVDKVDKVDKEKKVEKEEKKEETDDKKVHVLRKLSLEGVSDAAVRAQAASRPAPRRVMSKKDRDRQRQDADVDKALQKKPTEVQQQIKKKEGIVEIPEAITVKEFAEKTGVQVPKIISVLMKNGVMATINQTIDFDTAGIVAHEFKVQVKKAKVAVSAEGLLAGNLATLLEEEDKSVLKVRPPVVTVMGHVDHGKTAILDAIRKTDVVSQEAGGITQGIGAYQVEHEGKHITFLDTPGHQAFTAMRARGAQITDIVVLVVAAEEGIKPTTIEAIDHAKDAGVPILVAINKIDKEGADKDRVMGELAQHELQPEEWGGQTPVVACSAKTGQGISDLLDHILILAEIGDLKANPNRSAVGTIIESHLDPSLGPVGSVVVNAGTLKVGDIFVCGAISGKVKSMDNAKKDRIDLVGPSGAVRISGFSSVPETGDILQVVGSEQEAKKLHTEILAARELSKKRGISDLISRLSEGKLTTLKIVLKADSVGSLEAIEGALSKIKTESGAAPKVIHGSVGSIAESDVMMAAASGGIVLGFDVVLSTHVERIAGNNGVEVRLYDVIYELLDEVTGILEGLIEPEEKERVIGRLEVKGMFFRKRSDQVIGGKVTEGILKRVPFRILRGTDEVGTGRITSLRHIDKDVKEAKEGKEYGMRIDCNFTLEEGDVLEAYVKEFKKKSE
jgi:translation initiation factor IF-2